MFSRRIDRCSSPLPLTLKPSEPSSSSTSSPTLVSSSLSSLSFKCLDVKNLPLCPANGPLFTTKFMLRVGFSISIGSRGLTVPSLHIVSPIDMSAHPAIVTISP